MNSIVDSTDAELILEFGTNQGHSTRIWAEALASRGSSGRIVTVDINDPTDDWHVDYALADRITFIKNDVRRLDWFTPIDILFIDDWHQYSHILWELWNFAKHVKIGGYILLDDTQHHNGMGDEASCGWDVTAAIQDWTKEVSLPWTNYPEAQGLGVIQVTHPIAHIRPTPWIIKRIGDYSNAGKKWLSRHLRSSGV